MRLVHGDAAGRSSAANLRENRTASAAPARRRAGGYSPLCRPRRRFRDSSAASEEFRNVAGMPPACSASTWSFISAISGETTTVRPSRASAGSWKQSDLPPPVGSSAKTSLPASESRMISSCNGRNEVKPKYCFSSGSRFGETDFNANKVGQARWSSSFSYHRRGTRMH